MRISTTELNLLREIARGNKKISQIAIALAKSKAQTYRSGQKLVAKGLISRQDGVYTPAKVTHVSMILQLLERYPSLVEPFSGSGLLILTALLEPKRVSEIMNATGVQRTQIFKKLAQARKISLVTTEQDRCALNSKLWPNAVELIQELKKYEETTDGRVPSTARIYHRTENDILYASTEEQDATLTGFSAYADYGIKLLLNARYYRLPKRKLTKRDVFIDSLRIAEKDGESRQIILAALFYAKYERELQGITNELLYTIKKIFEGATIPGYPTLQEIQARAEVYDIKL